MPEGQAGTDFAAAGVGARFHKGFLEALQMIWASLLDAVNSAIETKERPLWITGHSLGGAIALMAAWRLLRNFVCIHEIVTFGAPMIGNEIASKAFEQEFSGKIYRFVDLEDVVPHLPSVSLIANAYTHCPNEVGLSAVQVVTNGLEALKAAAGTQGVRAMNASLADQVWEVVRGRMCNELS
jgi:pimeloyl-ACP methyl ester carboxylesterase